MPCFDGREDRDKRHAAKAVPLLCAVVRKLLADSTPVEQWPEGLHDWHIEHAKIDKEDGR